MLDSLIAASWTLQRMTSQQGKLLSTAPEEDTSLRARVSNESQQTADAMLLDSVDTPLHGLDDGQKLPTPLKRRHLDGA